MIGPSPREVPVSAFLAVSIIIVFSLYTTSAIKEIPCGKTVMSSFMSAFVHTKPYHMAANLYALYALTRVEQEIGPKKFFGLILFILALNVIMEAGMHKLNPELPCSIGFSGVLFGVTAWDMVRTKKLDFFLITSIIGMVALPSFKEENVSLTGHAVGAASGVIGGILWNKLFGEGCSPRESQAYSDTPEVIRRLQQPRSIPLPEERRVTSRSSVLPVVQTHMASQF